jgi:hypothetical protein
MALLFLIKPPSHLFTFFNESELKSRQSQTTRKTYNLLSFVHTWPDFSNHTAGPGSSRVTASNSLEAIHDTIHGAIGGHMGEPAVAGRLFCVDEFLGNT